jgi:hypothetical protein
VSIVISQQTGLPTWHGGRQQAIDSLIHYWSA